MGDVVITTSPIFFKNKGGNIVDNNFIILTERNFIKKFNLSNEYFCEITDELDKYNIGFNIFAKTYPDEKNIMRSYLIDPSDKIIPGTSIIYIRVPGSTVGYINASHTNAGYIIRSISFYNTNMKVLHDGYKSLEDKYIGKFLIYPRDDK